MARKNRNSKSAAPVPEDDEDAVRLPSLFGIKPGKYLAALFCVIILLVLFFLLVFPGLTNPGSALVVRTGPRGAAIRVDDVYFAASPCTIFVPEGRHTVTAVMPGFIDKEVEIDAGGRLFGSRFFPRKLFLSLSLDESSPLAALIAGASEFAAWSFAGEPTETRQIPLALSEGARRSMLSSGLLFDKHPQGVSSGLLFDRGVSRQAAVREAEDILKAAARFMTTRAALKDLLRAEFFIHSGGLAASPVNSLTAARSIIKLLCENPAFAVSLGDVLPDDAANRLIDSSLYPEVWTGGNGGDNEAAVRSQDRRPPPASVSTARFPLTVEGVNFSPEFLSTFFLRNSAFQHEEQVGNFMISLDEITVSQWAAFVREHPEWSAEKSASLAGKKLATEDYLAPLRNYMPPYADFFAENPDYPAQAVCGISWFAARDFCAWLNEKLPPALARDYRVRLPTESEWEYAAKYAEGYFGPPTAPAPRRMTAAAVGAKNDPGRRGLWEWCDDYFAPLNYLDAPDWAKTAVASPERGVRGGSWGNQEGSVSADTRGSLAPESCSPFVGFRVVIAEK
jgi:formylglycine-generating enzyme required for sulfatase activity